MGICFARAYPKFQLLKCSAGRFRNPGERSRICYRKVSLIDAYLSRVSPEVRGLVLFWASRLLPSSSGILFPVIGLRVWFRGVSQLGPISSILFLPDRFLGVLLLLLASIPFDCARNLLCALIYSRLGHCLICLTTTGTCNSDFWWTLMIGHHNNITSSDAAVLSWNVI